MAFRRVLASSLAARGGLLLKHLELHLDTLAADEKERAHNIISMLQANSRGLSMQIKEIIMTIEREIRELSDKIREW